MIKLTLLFCIIWTFSADASSQVELVKVLNIGSSVNKNAQSENLNYKLETSKEFFTADLLKFITRQTTKHDIGTSPSIPHVQKIKTNKFRFWGEVFTNQNGQSFAIFMLAPQKRAKKVAVGSTCTRLNLSPAPLNNKSNHSFELPWGKYFILRKSYTFSDELVGKKNGVFFQNKKKTFLVGALIQVKSLGPNVENFGKQFFEHLETN